MYKNFIIKKCLQCSGDFKTTNFYIKRGLGKFCSTKCSNRYHDKSGSKNILWKGGKSLHKCKYCNKIFYDHKSNNRKYCSWDCQIIGKRKGTTFANKWIRSSEKYKQWRQSVFIRDNFTCRICGIKGGILNAHHSKLSFSKMFNEIKVNLPLLDIKEASMVYTPFWELDNGITLCELCHRKLHKFKRKANG